MTATCKPNSLQQDLPNHYCRHSICLFIEEYNSLLLLFVLLVLQIGDAYLVL